METSHSNALKPKTHVLFIGVVLSILNAALPGFVPEQSINQQLLMLSFAIAFNVLIVFWCAYDSQKRGEKPGRYFTLSVIIFGVFALFYYLFKTRGFKPGLIAIGRFIVLFFGINLISAIVFSVFDSIF